MHGLSIIYVGTLEKSVVIAKSSAGTGPRKMAGSLTHGFDRQIIISVHVEGVVLFLAKTGCICARQSLSKKFEIWIRSHRSIIDDIEINTFLHA